MTKDALDTLSFLMGFLDISVQDRHRAETKLKRRGLNAIARRMQGKHTKNIALRILHNDASQPQAVDIMLLTEELIRCVRTIRDPDTITTINAMIDRW